jgi:hypothetical protein
MRLSAGRSVEVHVGTQCYFSRQDIGAECSMHSFRDPWQTQLVHLNCELEDVVETVSSHFSLLHFNHWGFGMAYLSHWVFA